jgi:DNA-directed RNA polymerase subunit RPC12/RpoP
MNEKTFINEYSLSRDMYAECPCCGVVRVVVLGDRLVERNIVNELIDNQTLLPKMYIWMARAVYKCSRQDPDAAYG